MQNKPVIKLLSMLLSLCLLFSSTIFPIHAFDERYAPDDETSSQRAVIPPIIITEGIFWSSSITDTYISRIAHTGNTISFSSLGLNPHATSGSETSYSFTWTSSVPSVATVNSSSGSITTLSEGATLISGTSTYLGSSVGQLKLLLFVTDESANYTMIGISEMVNGVTVDRTASFQDVGQIIYDMGYYDSRVYGAIPQDDPVMTAALFAAYMSNTDILYFRGHGSQTSIALNAAQNVSFRCSYVNELPANAFSNCELVLYASCSTATGGATGTNLVNSTANRGAGTVVGFETTVISTEVDAWSKYFFYALNTGDTVEDACSYADTELWKNRRAEYYNPDGILGTQTWRVAGNSSATFN